MISNNFWSFLTATHIFPINDILGPAGSVCWFRHCCRNHFYLFTASASHDEAAFCPQWGWAPSIRVSAKKFPNVKEKYWEKSEKCKFSEPPHGWRGCGVPGNYCWKCFAFEHFPNMFFKDTYVTFSLCESKILKMTWLIYTQFFSMVIHKYYQCHWTHWLKSQ